MADVMTADEYEAEYARASRVPVDKITVRAVPCSCGSFLCQGFKMVPKGGK